MSQKSFLHHYVTTPLLSKDQLFCGGWTQKISDTSYFSHYRKRLKIILHVLGTSVNASLQL